MDANNAVFKGTALAACLSLQLDRALLCRGSYVLFCFQQCILLCSDSRNHASTSTVHELMLAQSIKTTLAAHLPWISAAVQPLDFPASAASKLLCCANVSTQRQVLRRQPVLPANADFAGRP